jgi:hypothetical protein
MLFASDMTVRRNQNGDRYGKTESISATLIYHYVLQRNKRLTACVVPAGLRGVGIAEASEILMDFLTRGGAILAERETLWPR